MNKRMSKSAVISELEGLDGSLITLVPDLSRKYWEGYRNAMCKVIGVSVRDYLFTWEAL